MFESKSVIVTGAAQGIGRAVARHLGQLGHRLFLIDINETELCYAATQHIPQATSSVRSESGLEVVVGYRVCNLRDAAAVRETVKEAARLFDGRIDVLVNNAGNPRPSWTDNRTIEDPSVLDDWLAYLETNLTGAFVASQAVIPFMKVKMANGDNQEPTQRSSIADAGPTAAGPCIINISSIHARHTEPNCEGYAASKAGLLGLTQGLAISGAQWGIRCNAILPGMIERNNENRKADEIGKEWPGDRDPAIHAKHPAGRIGSGEDIARTVQWLIETGFVSGESIMVDGGASKMFPI